MLDNLSVCGQQLYYTVAVAVIAVVAATMHTEIYFQFYPSVSRKQMNLSRNKKKLLKITNLKNLRIFQKSSFTFGSFLSFYVKEMGTAGVHNKENCDTLLTRYKTI